MDIKPYDKTIRDLLGSKRQFIIPRFQREYSWDKKNYQEFLEDIVGNLVIKEGKISSTQYFLGTMLFIGNFTEGTEQEIQVVDGQQRLTTITILFSALSDRFAELGQATLSRQLFSYIMTEDDDGNEVRILKSKTSYPFFSYFIQDKDKALNPEATTEEEHCIKVTYEYFRAQLTETKLKAMLKRKHGSEIVEALSEVDILKALRDQVLNSTFVSISTTDRDQANKIFEIQNKLITPLDELFPTFETFSAKFAALTFTKKDKVSNVKTKYAINKLNNFYSNTEVFADDGSIEHIISEREGGDALNIGNLILLEGNLNDEAGYKDYSNKCVIYATSNYVWVKNFIIQHEQWDSSMIAQRAIELSKVYYGKILKKELPTISEI